MMSVSWFSWWLWY